jgi:hypothetical protein
VRRLIIAFALVTAACSGTQAEPTIPPVDGDPVDATGETIPPAPPVASGPLAAAVIADLDAVFADLTVGVDLEALGRLGLSGDARIAWLFSDLLRFFQAGPVAIAVHEAFEELTDTPVGAAFGWRPVTDWLIAWDVPAPPGYLEWKRRPFEIIEPAWQPFFDDAEADIDWRLLSWGGVRIDARTLEEAAQGIACPQGCIPALNDPEVTGAAGGDWYPDHRVVFGVVVNGEARAYPKNIMEVHEMVNDTLGGREIGIPYCTLCGSAQAYFTDTVPAGFDTLELRTSGLLARSNKVMFDLHTGSVFDTFVGTAVSGPLREAGFELEMISMVTSTWEDWKAAHPETTIVASDGGIGRDYPPDPLGGRDDRGPIFPTGDVDPRLPVHAQVVGVVTAEGTAVAFPVEAARVAMADGDTVALAGVRVITDGAGLLVETLDGETVASHQSFWFAWSQFHPDTLLWGTGGL